MRTIPKAILDKIAPDTIADAFVPLLRFGLTVGNDLHYVHYGSAITYNSQVYTPWQFEGTIAAGSKGGRIPRPTLTIDDAMETLRQQALATSWFQGCTLTLAIVCTSELAVSYTWSTATFKIVRARPRGQSLELTLGGQNLVKMRHPANRFWAHQCPYVRGFASDPRCGYSGAETECNGSLADCTARSNEANFGGFLGLDAGASQLVLPIRFRRA